MDSPAFCSIVDAARFRDNTDVEIYDKLHSGATSQYELLMTPVFLLGLSIRGSRLEKLIQEVVEEVRKRGISLTPQFYLSDEFGCVQNTVNIGVPFYLVDPQLEKLNRRVGSEKTSRLTDPKIKMILRHECGHAFFYAYGIRNKRSAERLFGDFSRKRTSLHRVKLDTVNYVNYLGRRGAASPGYSQCHPEEDFADTFAACIDPRVKEGFFTSLALKKMRFISRLIPAFAGRKPGILSNELDKPHEEIRDTVESFFRKRFGAFDLDAFRIKAYGYVDDHLRQVFGFNTSSLPDAARFLVQNRRRILRNNRTAIPSSSLLKGLIDKSVERARVLRLTVPKGKQEKTFRIYCAVLQLMATLLEENGRMG